MRTILSIFIFSLFFLSSCGEEVIDKNEDNTKQEETVINEPEPLTEAPSETNLSGLNCDEFLDKFEKWMDEYLLVMENMKKNRNNAVILMEGAKKMHEGGVWATQWSMKAKSCMTQEKYVTRFEKIAEKGDKKMEELGDL